MKHVFIWFLFTIDKTYKIKGADCHYSFHCKYTLNQGRGVTATNLSSVHVIVMSTSCGAIAHAEEAFSQ